LDDMRISKRIIREYHRTHRTYTYAIAKANDTDLPVGTYIFSCVCKFRGIRVRPRKKHDPPKKRIKLSADDQAGNR
jgi:hypothetical protein